MKEQARSDADLFREVRQHFFVPPDLGVLVADVSQDVNVLPEPYRSIGQAFAHNLRAVVETSSLPFAFAIKNAQDLQWQRTFLAERIRARSIEPEAGEHDGSPALELRRDEHARESARARFRDFLDSKEGRTLLSRDASEHLIAARESQNLQQAFTELLLQSLVLTWSAFEVLARDFFVSYVNHVPGAVGVLLADVSCRKRFDAAKVPLEVLSEHGYDLSKKMGTVLASQNDLADLATIKVVFLTLFGSDPTLRARLEDRRLWLIAQRRHLIVHRRAIVDAEFLKNTNENVSIGARLALSPADLEEAITVLRDAGTAILSIAPRH